MHRDVVVKRPARSQIATVFAVGVFSLMLGAGTVAAGQSQSESHPIIIPAGAPLVVRMVEAVDSTTNKVGDHFSASLEADLMANGRLIAPRGAAVYGRLAEAHRAGRLAGRSELKLELTDILIDDRLQPILTGEYEIAGASRGANTLKKTAGSGAIGAAAGAVVGAGAVAQVFTRGPRVRVPSETVLEFRLRQPLAIN